MSLLALAASGITSTQLEPVKLVLSPSVNIVVDGNSITNEFMTSGMGRMLTERLDALGQRNRATISPGGGLGINGQTWRNMAAVAEDVDASWRDGSTNVLICGETTNSIFNSSTRYSVAQTIADATQYCARVRSIHPWIVILWGSIPRGHGNEVTYPGEQALNARMSEVDAYMAASFAYMGAHGFVDVRSASPQFDHDGSDAALFAAFADAWCEQVSDPAGQGWHLADLGWTHPANGAWPTEATPGTGKRAIAARIADYLTSQVFLTPT